jgi:acyl dehydratase
MAQDDTAQRGAQDTAGKPAGAPGSAAAREAAGAGTAARLYFDELQLGQRFVTASYTMSAEAIRAFAAQFDPQPFHLDEQAGRASLFGGLVASGWHTAAVTMRLLVEGGLPLAGGAIGLGVQIEWRAPVRPGDRLHVRGEITQLVPSRSNPNRGRVFTRNETLNESGTVVQVADTRMLVPRRP